MGDRVRAARRTILASARDESRGLPFADGVMRAVNQAVGFDGYCLFAVDPVTGLRCAMYAEHGLVVPTERLVFNETVERDFNRYAELIRRPGHAGVLAMHTTPEPPSPRLHEILRPLGYQSELRLALVDDGRYWGALSLFRDDRWQPFSDAEAETAAELVGPLATALRRHQVRRTDSRQATRSAGIVLVGREGRFLTVSQEAQTWLGDLTSEGVIVEDVSRVVHEVARAAAAGRRDALCRARTTDGRWLVISGSRTPVEPVAVTVVVQPADTGQVIPAFAAWSGLSHRESEVLGLATTGLAAKQIARRLGLSVLTVNDHLGSTYRKTGVSGRDELLALMS
ncbi:DNA-binding CsgD family transcriptional regulator [Kribbella pratensis]|uniref:DNA-binding CsgD family transcriptional regulator n=1 Tax=Kribbella pratensis TaxID=2512112 RepID=A0ABY2FEW6_9ACTN|nr:LuxR C-terminal-related transcriptional regulator [Kribbella pratensis]TDW89784.1 DNA-binding CsgD family transcriptional regulator [Kribbella pratensis]